jgi:hypothetical protein
MYCKDVNEQDTYKIKLFKRNQQRNLDISGMKHDKNIKKKKQKI